MPVTNCFPLLHCFLRLFVFLEFLQHKLLSFQKVGLDFCKDSIFLFSSRIHEIQGSRDSATQSSDFVSSSHVSQQNNIKNKSTAEGEDFIPKRIIVHALKASVRGNANPPTVVSKTKKAKSRPNSQQLEIKLPSKEPIDAKFVASQPQSQSLFKVNENVEVLSQDSGLRGCWFRCKILHCSKKFLKVEYYDVLDVDGPSKQKERVPSSRAANFDKLGMRCVGRFTVRPWPCDDLSDTKFETGDAVDAWWCDGWWEGIVIRCHLFEESRFEVYLPAENIILNVERAKLRASKDWIENKWIDIKANPNVLSLLSSISNPKLPPVSIFSEATTSSAHAKGKDCSSSRVEGSKDAKSTKAESEEILPFKKRLHIKHNGEVADM